MFLVRRLSLILAILLIALPLNFAQAQKKNTAKRATPAALSVYTTHYFVIKSDSDAQFVRGLGVKLDEYFTQLIQKLPTVLGEKMVTVKASLILFEKQDAYQRYARRNAPQLVNNGGYYDGATRTIVTYRYNNSIQLYFHEILHAVMGEFFNDHYFFRYSRSNWPIWFDEGLAEYFGSFEARGSSFSIGARNKTKIAYLLNALSSNSFVPLKKLLTAPSIRFSGASMNLYYAESWGLMDFLIKNEPYNKKLPEFFRAIRKDMDGMTAFTRSFGSDLEDLERRWRAHLWSLGAVADGWQSLFNGQGIDMWTVHEGGRWRVKGGVIDGVGDENYNYLIRSELPLTAFTFDLEMKVIKGTTGLILGNNFHGEYPYYYLVDIAKDHVTLRRSYSATRIATIKEIRPLFPEKQWLPVSVQLLNERLKVWVNGQLVLNEAEDKDRYSLFGVYLYQGHAQFRNIRIRKESPVPPAAPKRR